MVKKGYLVCSFTYTRLKRFRVFLEFQVFHEENENLRNLSCDLKHKYENLIHFVKLKYEYFWAILSKNPAR